MANYLWRPHKQTYNTWVKCDSNDVGSRQVPKIMKSEYGYYVGITHTPEQLGPYKTFEEAQAIANLL